MKNLLFLLKTERIFLPTRYLFSGTLCLFSYFAKELKSQHLRVRRDMRVLAFWSFLFLHLDLWPLCNLFLCMVWAADLVLSFLKQLISLFVKKPFFAPVTWDATFIKCQIPTCAWVYFWTFCSFPRILQSFVCWYHTVWKACFGVLSGVLACQALNSILAFLRLRAFVSIV